MSLARVRLDRYSFHAPLRIRSPHQRRMEAGVVGGAVVYVVLVLAYLVALVLWPEAGLPSISVRVNPESAAELNLTAIAGLLSMVGVMTAAKLYFERNEGKLHLTERYILISRKGYTRIAFDVQGVQDIRLQLVRPRRTVVSELGSPSGWRYGYYAALSRVRFTFVSPSLQRSELEYHFCLLDEEAWIRMQWMLMCWEQHNVRYRLEAPERRKAGILFGHKR